ncbi:MAG TPA: type II toxin-antitoxin system death-on-curing family toxin [Pyrinomonadaceae bacterium]|nr:type II toxin-antitoxin system death-on-curing family toxin [Pyrinomonadaceae bacterium]
METETVYIKYEEAVLIHFSLMQRLGESRYGVDHRDLIESALARPQNSAVYANADIIRQSATLLFGLIKNHPWLGGNKRTATTLLRRFLELNGYQKTWTIAEQIELVLAVESDQWNVDEIENWLRPRVKKN